MSYVMIVDDDEDFAYAAARVLRAQGHEVDVEFSTWHALMQIRIRRPDLVILDVMFPEDNTAGFRLARHIRQQPGAGGLIPVMMLTAASSRSVSGAVQYSGTDAGRDFDAFLEKPLDLQTLIDQTASLLADQHGPDAN